MTKAVKLVLLSVMFACLLIAGVGLLVHSYYTENIPSLLLSGICATLITFGVAGLFFLSPYLWELL